MEYKNRIVGQGEVKLDEILFNPRNWRIHPLHQQDALKGVLEEVGWVQQVIVNKRTGNLIDGHLRCQLAAREGNDTIPVVYVDVSEEEEALILSTLDPIAGMAATDKEKLDDLFRQFNSDNENVQKLIADIAEKEKLEFGKKPIEDVEPQIDKAEELRVKWNVETGQMWKLGEHRIICGDCTDKAVVERVMGLEKAQTLFTSPPCYMVGDLYQDYADNLKSEKYIEFNLQVINNLIPHIRGYLFWNISYNKNSRWEFIEIFHKIVKESGLRFLELIVWDKGHGMPIVSKDMLTRSYEDILLMATEDMVIRDLEWVGLFGTEKKAYFNKNTMRGITNYWKIGTNKSQNDDLLACFPVELPARGIILTTSENDIVADCFLGSGTTLLVSERLNRKCRAIEISPAYVAVSIQRWVDATGGTPELIEQIE